MSKNTINLLVGITLLIAAGAALVVYKPFRGAPDREIHDPTLVDQESAGEVRRFHYLEDTQTLVVYFEAASRMDFKGVPPALGRQAMNTEAKTSFYLEHIKGKYSL